MTKQRKSFSAELKARIALEAIKGQMTVNQIATHYGVHPNRVTTWKKQLLDEAPQFFARNRARAAADDDDLKAQLYQQIGQLKVELDWLKKNYRCKTHSKS
jgi:transposase-like protein